jgi:hypothetical protein
VGTGIYFSAYESLKYLLSGTGVPGPLTYAISGAFCGVVAWCIVFPIDTAKVFSPTPSHRPMPLFPYFTLAHLVFPLFVPRGVDGRVLFNEIFYCMPQVKYTNARTPSISIGFQKECTEECRKFPSTSLVQRVMR